MKKTSLFLLCIFAVLGPILAAHIKGGWIQYEYLGPGTTANSSQYRITIRQYLSCASTVGQRDAQVYLGIFDAGTNALLTGAALVVPLAGSDNPNKQDFGPCISGISASDHLVCYFIDKYVAVVDLPNNGVGYVLTVQRCCRIGGIANIDNSFNTGVSYTNRIPGLINGVDYSKNSSPVFAQRDTAVVCYSSAFTFDFSATDADNDKLVYHFCDGLVGGSPDAGGSAPNPPSSPPYISVSYTSPASGTSPMGPGVTINPNTGIISGIAPSVTGDYVVAVCADEYRNGVFIGSTKKEIHITVANCTIASATLKPTYYSCNGTLVHFQNESTSSSITSYNWDFGVQGITTDVSTNPTPSYDYSLSGKDSGSFTIKLVVANAAGCKDSATSLVKVYPGFVPKFGIIGSCFQTPYQFVDSTTSKYGLVNSRSWNFGDITTLADTALSKDSAWKYPAPADVLVKLVAGDSKGCTDSVTRSLTIADKPSIQLAFRDTLICSNDSLLLKVTVDAGTVVTWTPQTGPNQSRIANTNSATPLVFPHDTTLYRVAIDYSGCKNTDSVKVNVLQFISVNAGKDTGVCKTDTFRLNPVSYALSYVWRSSSGEAVQNTKYPLVQPLVNTDYYVLANLGKCQARDTVDVTVAAYPMASVNKDTAICFGTRLQLHGVIAGSSFYWTPEASLSNAYILNPVAAPTKTTSYILFVSDTLGCPKTSADTVLVAVTPPVNAYAGKDTVILPNTPLQLNASGGSAYFWSPATYLSVNDIPNPIVTLGNSIDSITYRVIVSVGACASSDDITIRVYKNGPDILVPSAFTPNGDGLNDVARPTMIGISRINYFSIYNRWGKAVFTTTEFGKGWDGIYNGVPQKSDTYVYRVEGIDPGGNVVFRKGTIALIR